MADRQLLVGLVNYFYENGAPPFNYNSFFKVHGADGQLSRANAYRVTRYIRRNKIPPWMRGDLGLEEKFRAIAERFVEMRDREGYCTDKNATDTENESRPRTVSRAYVSSRTGRKRKRLLHTDDEGSDIGIKSPDRFVGPLTPASMQEEPEYRYRTRSRSRSMTQETPEGSMKGSERKTSRRRNNSSDWSASSRRSNDSRRSARLAGKRQIFCSILPQIQEKDERERSEPQDTPKNRKRQKLVEEDPNLLQMDIFITPPKEKVIVEEIMESEGESELSEPEETAVRRKSLVARRLSFDLENSGIEKQEIQEEDTLKELTLYDEVFSQASSSPAHSGPVDMEIDEENNLNMAICEGETDSQRLSSDNDKDAFGQESNDEIILSGPVEIPACQKQKLNIKDREHSPILEPDKIPQNDNGTLRKRVTELEGDLLRLTYNNYRLNNDLALRNSEKQQLEDEAAVLREEVVKGKSMVRELWKNLEKEKEKSFDFIAEVKRERKARKKTGRILLEAVLDLMEQNTATVDQMSALRKELTGLTKMIQEKKK